MGTRETEVLEEGLTFLFVPCGLLDHFLFLYKCSEVTRSCPTLCNPLDCSSPGSSIHGILQARILGLGCHFLLHPVLISIILIALPSTVRAFQLQQLMQLVVSSTPANPSLSPPLINIGNICQCPFIQGPSLDPRTVIQTPRHQHQ